MNSKITPYDTGKVKIGVYYEPPMQNTMTEFDAELQAALLGGKRSGIAQADRFLMGAFVVALLVMALVGLFRGI